MPFEARKQCTIDACVGFLDRYLPSNGNQGILTLTILNRNIDIERIRQTNDGFEADFLWIS